MGNGGQSKFENPEVEDSEEAFNEVSRCLIKVWASAERRSSWVSGVGSQALGSHGDSGIPAEI